MIATRKLPAGKLPLILFLLLTVAFCAASRAQADEIRKVEHSSDSGNHKALSAPENSPIRLPLTIEANEGQAGPEVEFLARCSGYTVYFASKDILFAIPIPAASPGGSSNRAKGRVPERVANFGTVKMSFRSMQESARLEGNSLLPGHTNYYVGSDPRKWIAGVPNYGAVKYSEIYPGISAVVHGVEGEMEFDLVVEPHADASQIVLQFSGARSMRITGSGDLELVTRGGALRLKRPAMYQEGGGARRVVSGRFVVLSKDEAGFLVADYERERSLTIDPMVSYATRLGGMGTTSVTGIGADASGNAVVVGYTRATGFPTQDPFQGYLAGTQNAFVTKVDPTASNLIFSTYFGGGGTDQAAGVALDGQGNIYVAGTTNSSDFPTTASAYLRTCPMIQSCGGSFLGKFLPDGTLAYSTFTGGSTLARAVAVDPQGNAYITGSTQAHDLPIVNAFQPTYVDDNTSPANVFVQKFDPSGSQLLYSTYLGGGIAWGIAADSQGSAYVAGTVGTIFPVQSPLRFGSGQFFLTKFSPAGDTLAYSTLLGGNSADRIGGIGVDGSGNAYVTGNTSSHDFPITLSPGSTTCGVGTALDLCNQSEVFALAMNAAGTGLIYSRFLGHGQAEGIAVDSSGNASITGVTAPSLLDIPLVNAVESGPQPQPSPYSGESFVTTLDAQGSITFSSYLGGIFDGMAMAVAKDPVGNIYVGGSSGTSSLEGSDFYAVGPQHLPGCCSGGFVERINPSNTPVIGVGPLAVPLVTLRNLSNVPVHISSIAQGNKTFSGTCGPAPTLAAGAGCWLITDDSIDPLTITSDGAGSPQKFYLLQNPSGALPPLFPQPERVYLPPQLSGTSSEPQHFALVNLGSQPVPLQAISIFGDGLALSDACGATVPAGGYCSLSVTFTPTGTAQGGSIQISAPPTNDVTIGVGGLGTTNALYSSAAFLNFGTQYVGAPPLPLSVFLTNSTPGTVNVTGIALSGPYTEVDNCGSPLQTHATCQVAISFAPTHTGPLPGNLTVSQTGVGGPVSLVLLGNGQIISPLAISPVPVPLIFAYVGQTNMANFTLSLTNQSQSPVAITSISLADPQFAQTNDCPVSPATLSPNAACSVSLTFTPTAAGSHTTLLTVVPSSGASQVVDVNGMAIAPLEITPAALEFGDQALQTTSGEMAFNVVNRSTQAITIQSLAASGDFQISRTCLSPGMPLQSQTGCGINMTFTPTAVGPRTGSLTVMASDSPDPHVYGLTGTGVSQAMVSFSPSALQFAAQTPGTTSQAQTVMLTNTGSGALEITNIGTSAQFSQTNNCPQTLAADAQCAISVSFAPTSSGPQTGSLMITDDAEGSPQSLPLFGDQGAQPAFSAGSLSFPSQVVGAKGMSQSVSLMNQGTASLSITSISVSPGFKETDNCGSSVAAMGSCMISITFVPAAAGSQSGTLTVFDNVAGGVQTLPLNGVATDFELADLSASNVPYGIQRGLSITIMPEIAGLNGYSGTITLSCSTPSPGPTCGVSPGSVMLSNNNPVFVNVVISAQANLIPLGEYHDPGQPAPRLAPFAAALLALLLLLLPRVVPAIRPRRAAFVHGLAAIVLIVMLAACGGGGTAGSMPPPQGHGTPAGNYTVTLTGTSSGVSRSVQFQILVQ